MHIRKRPWNDMLPIEQTLEITKISRLDYGEHFYVKNKNHG